jgi:hypothetical protein
MLSDESSGLRFAQEYSKAELILRDWRIRSTTALARLNPVIVTAIPAWPLQPKAATLQWHRNHRGDNHEHRTLGAFPGSRGDVPSVLAVLRARVAP